MILYYVTGVRCADTNLQEGRCTACHKDVDMIKWTQSQQSAYEELRCSYRKAETYV